MSGVVLSQSSQVQSTSRMSTIPVGWACCIQHLWPVHNSESVITVGVLLEGCCGEGRSEDEVAHLLLPASFCFRKLFSRSWFSSYIWTQGSCGSAVLSKQLPKPFSKPDALATQGLENLRDAKWSIPWLCSPNSWAAACIAPQSWVLSW